MKKIIGTLLTLVSLNTFAVKNNYLIQTQFYKNDKKVGSPLFGVLEGEKGSIELKENFIDLVSIKTTTEDEKNLVKMSFEVGSFDKDGQKIVVAKSSMISQENQKTVMVFTTNNGEDTYKLEIIPTKQPK